jgi:hypothetical protein
VNYFETHKIFAYITYLVKLPIFYSVGVSCVFPHVCSQVALIWNPSQQMLCVHERCLSTVYPHVYNQGTVFRKSCTTNGTFVTIVAPHCVSSWVQSGSSFMKTLYNTNATPLRCLSTVYPHVCSQVALPWKKKLYCTNSMYKRCPSSVYHHVLAYSQGALLRKSFTRNGTLPTVHAYVCWGGSSVKILQDKCYTFLVSAHCVLICLFGLLFFHKYFTTNEVWTGWLCSHVVIG